jgi:type I restriction-modification system DNA methylase subunit
VQAALYRRLTEFLDRFAGERHVPRAIWIRRFFEALDWGERAAFSIQKNSDTEFDLHVEGCPLVTVISSPPSAVEDVYRGLNRAYNRDVPWLVATNVESLGLFGSYWISFPHDISGALAWQLQADEYLLEAPKLNLLTPQEVVRNELDQLYEHFPLRPRRHPIDVHLVDRMSEWRQKALEALGDPKKADDPLIYRFINSLFLVRYLEDSALTDQNLKDLLGLNRTDLIAKLRSIFRIVRDSVNYPTIRFSDLQRLEPTPLKTLISELYAYRQWGVEYDFAAMSVDILGRFYEEYLRLTPQRIVLTPRQRVSANLFASSSQKLTDIRQEKGIFYTPAFVVNYIVSNIVRRHEASQRQTPPLVVDLACGSGSFLVSVIEEMAQRERWITDAPRSIIGLDSDERAIEAARFNLVAKCLAERLNTPIPDLRLHTYNLLRDGPNTDALKKLLGDKGVDIVVGNPPYISYERLARDYNLESIRRNFQLASKRTDSYMLFVEAALNILRPGGFCGLVLPNVFLRSASAGLLREWVTTHADLLEIIDFQDQPVFQNVGVYVCILLLRKKEPNKAAPKILIGKVYQLSKMPATQLAKLGVSQQTENGRQEVFYTEPLSGTRPWLFRNPHEREILDALTSASTPFSKSGLEIYQGVKTGLDDVFVLDSPEQVAAVETEITVPFIRSRDLTRWFTRPKSRLIYPYDRTTGTTMTWSRIQKMYPKCATYLESRRAMLSGRRSQVNEKWYELIRPRVQSVLTKSPKLFLAELTVRPRTTICQEENAAIAGGTGGGSVVLLTGNIYEFYSLVAFLNSSLVEWLARQAASVRRGGWILIEQSMLRDLPVPAFLADQTSFARSELTRLAKEASNIIRQSSDLQSAVGRQQLVAIEDQIDSLLIGAAGLNAKQGTYIRERVSAMRSRSTQPDPEPSLL